MENLQLDERGQLRKAFHLVEAYIEALQLSNGKHRFWQRGQAQAAQE